MFKHVVTHTKQLTEELAQEFATMKSWKGERPVKPKRLNFLRARLHDGHFYPPRWAIAWFRGEKVRMNGQHSSLVLAEANGHFPKALNVVVDEFTCDTEQDLAELFAQFDPPESNRNPTEACGAHARTIEALDGIKTGIIRDAIAGIAKHIQLIGGTKPSTEERARLVYEHTPFVAWFPTIDIDKPSARHLRKVAVMASMFTTHSINAEGASDFWKLVVTEQHAEVNHPTRKLARFLRDCNTVSQRAGQTNAMAAWDDRAVYSKCIHSWNAFRDGRVTDLKYYADSPIPVAK